MGIANINNFIWCVQIVLLNKLYGGVSLAPPLKIPKATTFHYNGTSVAVFG